MSIQTSFRIRLANRPGELLKLTNALSQAGINIEGGAGINAGGTEGTLQLLVNDTSRTEQILREQNISFEKIPLVLTWIPEKVGGLAATIKPLADAGLNIDTLFGVRQEGDQNLLAFGVNDPEKADKILSTRSNA